ncbi:cupin [Larsenimonas salina]|uniref:cupin n=1 Tax=Larsenimonas salina TaxID=1295565 RepID=UPI0020730A84|nr:cupin [Larsenimonas salina]MCM5704536.1 cupin [Larsenimonas salina]
MPPFPDTFLLDEDLRHGVPNSSLPVLHYRRAFDPGVPSLAPHIERYFKANGWLPAWRYGLYPFDHFHTTAHEALGVYQGWALARLGGPAGREVMLDTGDVLVLPAGVSHACVRSGEAFSMVGAYPPGHDWMVERPDPAALSEALERRSAVALPECAPVGGALCDLWDITTRG